VARGKSVGVEREASVGREGKASTIATKAVERPIKERESIANFVIREFYQRTAKSEFGMKGGDEARKENE
jgi:hypothetical protein